MGWWWCMYGGVQGRAGATAEATAGPNGLGEWTHRHGQNGDSNKEVRANQGGSTRRLNGSVVLESAMAYGMTTPPWGATWPIPC